MFYLDIIFILSVFYLDENETNFPRFAFLPVNIN